MASWLVCSLLWWLPSPLLSMTGAKGSRQCREQLGTRTVQMTMESPQLQGARRCEHAATSPGVSGRCVRPVHRQSSGLRLLCFSGVLRHFSHASEWKRVPIFKPLSTHTVSARGLRGCRSRRELYSQVTLHWDCQLDRTVVST